MKKLSDFKENKLKTSELNDFFGGVKVTSSATTKLANGCTRYQFDEFEDADGDGLWDDNESGTYCSVTDCPPCIDV